MMMRNRLIVVSAICSLGFLFAFSTEHGLRESVYNLFIPTGTRPVAKEYSAPAEHPARRTEVEPLNFLAPKSMAAIAQQLREIEGDTLPPLSERYDDFINSHNNNPIDLNDPKAIEKSVEYDPVTNSYILTEKIGEDFYRAPTYMTFEEYVRWRDEQQQRDYFDRLQGVAMPGEKSNSGAIDPIARFDIQTSLIDRLFGGTNVDIKPQGNINLTFGVDYQKLENPILTLRQQRQTNFDFDMDINMSAQGKIGEKLNLNFNYNTQATFDFDNQMKLNYDTKAGNKGFSDDEILQGIQAGNVSLPLRSNLIKGAQNLFGIMADLKFGHLRTKVLASQQRSRQQSLTVQGGSQLQTFQKPIDEYDENRHFFLTHYNRNGFEKSMSCLPVPQSQFNVTRLEVWITNDKLQPTDTRDIVAMADLAEPLPLRNQFYKSIAPIVDPTGKALPDNKSNGLYPELLDIINADTSFRFSDKIINTLRTQLPKDTAMESMKQIRDFEKVRGRLLSPQEYTFDPQLGFVSINLNVQPDQVVGVAFEYTYNGLPYKVGEFTSDVPVGDSLNQNVLFVKMLKSTTANVKLPIWDLMMKNVYSIGAANVDPQEFRFDIYYEDPGKGQKRFLGGEDNPNIPASLRSRPLIQVFNLDNLNLQNDPGSDGIFDFVPGLTINLRSGRVMFPILEPFGSFLQDKMITAGMDPELSKKYVYPQLYDSTLFRAREFQQLNRFTLKGSYKSSSNAEISLGTFNLPPGSVRVTAGSFQMREGQDYIVDYNIGKVRIINDAVLQSGQNVNISFEDNTLFGFQNRTMLGARFDYEFNKDFIVGGTFMNLFERPLTQKVNFGDDPINNKVYGLDFSISKEAPWLTKFVDKIPLLNTKEPSTISASAEVAYLQPGFNRAINQGNESGGSVYIDDFEGTTSSVPLSTPANSWIIASTPQGDPTLFPESDNISDPTASNYLAIGANRARLSWYVADPSALDAVDASNPYTKRIPYQDIFPNRQLSPLEQSNLRSLDVTINPRQRGPYNYEMPDGYPGFSKGLNNLDGSLNMPETRWAGFMRGLNNNDFEAANIEFVEFWMLDPYIAVSPQTPVSEEGDMYIDLGSLSEDIMRDSRQFFENALPTKPNGPTVNTRWGRVPVLPPIVDAFSNENDKRPLQDVGLDGLNDEAERNFEAFKAWLSAIQASGLPQWAKDSILADPSGDNFVYFGDNRYGNRGSGQGLLQRYSRFNNPEGNSPINTNADANQFGFANPSATNYPDKEDLNRDNSLNETEAYFRYKIQLKKGPSGVGLDTESPELKDIITDVRTYTDGTSGQSLVWYRFKVPLDWKQRKAINGIQDFRSIRFVRMFWKGFTEQTTFRFATLELGRNQWRRFTQILPQYDANGNLCSDEVSIGAKAPVIPFDVNSVSVEENSARIPFNYTIPAGIQRERSVGAFPDILQNEQSLSMTLCDIPSCDTRGIFKTLNMDLRQFKRLKMFVHGENRNEAKPIKPEDLTVFIRMGSDFTNNYYEYEIPLAISDPTKIPTTANPDDITYKKLVWPDENIFDFPLDLLVDVKVKRNANPAALPGIPFAIPDPENNKHTVTIVGNPNLGYVKGIMVGIRNKNPKISDPNGNDPNSKCVEVWFNELRLNGLNNQGGYAGQARVDMKLADFGNVSLSGTYSSVGWGSLEQKINQRQREEIIQYDVSTNLELGKFFGDKFGLKLPFYWQYSNITKNPEYDPYDLDIKLKDKLGRETDAAKRTEIRHNAQDVTTTQGFNFTNVRKEHRGGARKIPMPWNIENFSLTYAQTEQNRRTPFIEGEQLKNYKGGLDWQYSTGLKPLTPFKKLIKKDKNLKFISEFNFNPLPNTYGFNSLLDRYAGKTTWRFAGEDPKNNTYYNRRFTWDRNYDLGWDISRGLKFNFDANARSLIDEPVLDADRNLYPTNVIRDSILTGLRHLGRPKNYTHNASLNWTLPFKQIPMLDFITMKASYTAGYTWSAQSLKLQNLDAGQFESNVNSRSLGNVIQNNNTRQINGDFAFETLYNKSKYLAKINKPAKKGGANSGRGGKDDGGRGGRGGDDPGGLNPSGDPGGMFPGGGGKGKDGRSAGKDDQRSPKDQMPLDPSAPARAGAGKDAAGKDANGIAGNPAAGKAGAADAKNAKDNAKDTKGGKDSKPKEREPSLAERIALRPLMLVRKARFTYSENFTTVVPGFTPDPKLMGLSEGFAAPGWDFVAGVQPDENWLNRAKQNDWITYRVELNQQLTRNYTQNFDAGVTLEPFSEFRVELNVNRQFTRNSTELFKDQDPLLGPDNVDYESRAKRLMGSYSSSYFALNTMFDKDINGLFNRYENNRKVISQRLGVEANNTTEHDRDKGYTYGYGKIHQEVLIPSFISAYTNKDPNTVGLKLFNTLPTPNWKLNYNGLSKVGRLKKVFSSIQISHGYKSTLTVNSYNSDLFFDGEFSRRTDDLNFNYIARLEIPQVVINEQLSPLLAIDVKTKNDMTFKLDMKKSRTLAMSFIDYQLAETQSSGYTFGFGYRLKNVNIPFLTGKKILGGTSKPKSSSKSKKRKTTKKNTKPTTTTPPPTGGGAGTQANDMNFKFDFELRDDITVNHRLDLPVEAEATRGARTIVVSPSVEYALNKRLKLRVFTNYRKTVPKTSQSFPITTIQSGVTVQFSLN